MLWWIYARIGRILCDIYSLQPGLLLSLSLPLRMGLLVLTISPGSIHFHALYTLYQFGSTDDFNFILWIIFFLDSFKSQILYKILSKKLIITTLFYLPSTFMDTPVHKSLSLLFMPLCLVSWHTEFNPGFPCDRTFQAIVTIGWVQQWIWTKDQNGPSLRFCQYPITGQWLHPLIYFKITIPKDFFKWKRNPCKLAGREK